ncbi:MAG: FRG domain-containing protein [Myxococcota bacterium]
MSRPWLTEGNLKFIQSFCASVRAHLLEAAAPKRKNIEEQARPHLEKLHSAEVEAYAHLGDLGIAQSPPPHRGLGGEPFFGEPEKEDWSSLFAEDLVASFGRGGPGAVATIAEAMLVVNALARAHWHPSRKVYFRGEHRYGRPLKSRAQRTLEKRGAKKSEIETVGISGTELTELRRFQKDVIDRSLHVDLVGQQGLPNDDDDPEWLPLMQHYDTSFGTRLIDLTRSIFAGLHFSCIDWCGDIDFDTDGLLYVFFDGGRRVSAEPGLGDETMVSVKTAFSGWQCPDYLDLFESSQSSMRELAQDGVFLVQGRLGTPKQEEAAVKGFTLRIPRWAKARIIEELKFAGYTPERIVRGRLGDVAARRAEAKLRRYRQSHPAHPGWS